MLKKSITYTDFDGNKRTEDYYFNLTKAELTEMEYSKNGGMNNIINKIIKSNDIKSLIEIFKDLILRSYGEKSLDGKRFIKNQELRDAFAATEAYSELFMELSSDAEAASAFVNGIIPTDIAAQMPKQIEPAKQLPVE